MILSGVPLSYYDYKLNYRYYFFYKNPTPLTYSLHSLHGQFSSIPEPT